MHAKIGPFSQPNSFFLNSEDQSHAYLVSNRLNDGGGNQV